MQALAGVNRRFSNRRLHERVGRESWRADHKLVARLYKEERFSIPRCHRQKCWAGTMSCY